MWRKVTQRFRIYWSVLAVVVMIAMAAGSAVVAYCIWPITPQDVVLQEALRKQGEHSRRVKKKNHVVLIDYDLPVVRKRLWVVEAESGRILLRAHVSHAWKSGIAFVSRVSNLAGTNLSSVGPFVTGESYRGKYGYAMRLDGLAPSVNDNARGRAIVFHSYRILKYIPFPGWSLGCFMTLPDINQKLIDMCKQGTLVYVHYSNRKRL